MKKMKFFYKIVTIAILIGIKTPLFCQTLNPLIEIEKLSGDVCYGGSEKVKVKGNLRLSENGGQINPQGESTTSRRLAQWQLKKTTTSSWENIPAYYENGSPFPNVGSGMINGWNSITFWDLNTNTCNYKYRILIKYYKNTGTVQSPIWTFEKEEISSEFSLTYYNQLNPGSLEKLYVCDPSGFVQLNSKTPATQNQGTIKYRFDVCYEGEPCDVNNWHLYDVFEAQSGYTASTRIITDNTTSVSCSFTPPSPAKNIKWVRRVVIKDEGCLTYSPIISGQTINGVGSNVKTYASGISTYVFAEPLQPTHLNPGSISLTNGSSNEYICLGGSITINSLSNASGEGSYLGGQYIWQKSANGGISWTDISSTNTATYTPTNITQETHYRRAYKRNCVTVYTNVVRVTPITLNPGSINSSTNNQNKSICYNTQPGTIISLEGGSGGGMPISYVWEFRNSMTSQWTVINGANQANYTPPALTVTTEYRRGVKGSVGDCSTVYANMIVKVTVYANHQAGTVGIESSQVCYNASGNQLKNITNQTGGNTNNFTYQWQRSINGTSWENIVGATTATYTLGNQTKTYLYRREDNAGCGSKYTNSVTGTVFNELTPGTIGTSHGICYGAIPAQINNVNSPLGGSGTYSYQWLMSTDGTTWQIVGGATGLSYQPTALQQTTHYKRKVIDACGELETNTVTVTVYGEMHPGSVHSDKTQICFNTSPGQIVNIQNATGGSGVFTYQWEVSPNNNYWQNISGATDINYTPESLTQSTYFRRKATNDCGFDYSNVIYIEVKENFLPGEIGSPQFICYNTSPEEIGVTIPATGGFGEYSYQWQRSNDNVEWIDVLGATSTAFQPQTLTVKSHYRLKATDQCGVKMTNTVTIDVAGILTGGEIGNSQTICYGATPAVLSEITSASGGMGSYSFRWEKKSESDNNWTIIPGANGNNIIPPALTETTQYKRIVQNSCGEAESNIVTISISLPLTGGIIEATNNNICYNAPAGVIIVTENSTGGVGDYTYQWQMSNNGSYWYDITDATQITYNPGTLTQNHYFRRKTIDLCGTAVSNEIYIEVKDEFLPGSIGEPQFICHNTTPEAIGITVATTGGFGEYNYQWQKSEDNLEWNDIMGANSTTYQPQSLIANRNYRLKVTDQCGVKITNTIGIEVAGILTGGEIGNSQTICYGATPAVISETTSATGGTGSHSFRWERKLIGENSWTVISEANGNTLTLGPQQASAEYKRVVQNSCGEAESNIIVINVSPEFLPGSIGHSGIICKNTPVGTITNVSLASGGFGNFSYTWEKSSNLQHWETIPGTLAEVTYGSISNETYFRRIAISQGCPNTPTEHLKIEIDPVKSEFTVNNQSVIIGEPVQFLNNSTNNNESLWSFNEGENRTEENPWVYFNIPGEKNVTLLVKSVNGCVDQVSKNGIVTMLMPTGFQDFKENLLTIYPNPTGEYFKIISNENETIKEIFIYDISGKTVMSVEGFREKIDVSSLEKGIYLVKIVTTQQNLIQKLIKQ